MYLLTCTEHARDVEDGRVVHGPQSRDRTRRQQHKERHAADGVSHPLPRL